MDISRYMAKTKEERQEHIQIYTPCEFGNTYQQQQLRIKLASYLDTEVPTGNRIHCCHVCCNGGCINLRHVYFGTPKENKEDGLDIRGIKTVHFTCDIKTRFKLVVLRRYYNATSNQHFLQEVINELYEEIKHDHEWMYKNVGHGKYICAGCGLAFEKKEEHEDHEETA